VNVATFSKYLLSVLIYPAFVGETTCSRRRGETVSQNCGHHLISPGDMSMERQGGMILTGETRKTWRKYVPVPLCPSPIPHGQPGANPGLRGKTPATNRLSHGTANMYLVFCVFVSRPASLLASNTAVCFMTRYLSFMLHGRV
jgi:hypothetical protein